MRVVLTKYHLFCKRLIISVTLLLLFSYVSYCQYLKNDLKAAYIENITRFIEWPASKLDPGKEKYIFGIYQDHEFFDRLNEVFSKRKIRELEVDIIEIKSPDQIPGCDICYFGNIKKTDFEKLLSGINSKGILCFSESEDLRLSGIHVNFYLESGKLRFEVNMKSMEKSGFHVSSVLLSSCKIIDK
jgi:hypothetical protein